MTTMSKAFAYAKENKMFTARPFGLEVDVSKVHPSALSNFMRELGDTLSSASHDVPTWTKDTDYATGDTKIVASEPLKGYKAERETVKRQGAMITKNGSIFTGGQQTRWKNLRFSNFPKVEQEGALDAVQELLGKK